MQTGRLRVRPQGDRRAPVIHPRVTAREQSLRDQVNHNGRTANDNIDNVQDAFGVLRAEAQAQYDDLFARLGASAAAIEAQVDSVSARLDVVEAKATQLGIVISSCLGFMSERVSRMEAPRLFDPSRFELGLRSFRPSGFQL